MTAVIPRVWAQSSGLENVHDNEVYQAMDWLHKRKAKIESQLAKRHLRDGSIVLCDTSSSYVEGAHMALAAFGYSRDGKKKKKQINYGVLLDQAGRSLGIEVFPGLLILIHSACS